MSTATTHYVLLQGGLGNQLFIVAAIYAFKERNPHLPIDFLFSPQTNMHLQNVTVRSSFEKNILKWVPRFDELTFRTILSRRLPIRHEPPQPPLTLNTLSPSIWLGYYQHADFVTPLPKVFRNAVVDAFRAYQQRQDQRSGRHDLNRIGVHIRRTDYCQLGHIYVQLNVTYYERAVRHLLPHLSQPNFHVYVFSDSISDAHETLDGLWKKLGDEGYHVTVIYGSQYDDEKNNNNSEKEVSEDRDLHDFFQLLDCPHVVTANSTFSWWAAVLHHEVHEKATTICPRRWFNDRPTPLFTVRVPVGHEWMDLDV